MLAHKQLYQRGFANSGLPADEHGTPISSCGRAKEHRQLFETVVTFEKVHAASSARNLAGLFDSIDTTSSHKNTQNQW